MHTITFEKKTIKILFDKKIQGWQYDKGDIKRLTLNDYKDYSTILLIPATAIHFSKLFKTFASNENYHISEAFTDNYQLELKTDRDLEIKRKLLKEKLTLDNIKDRPDLLDYNHLPKEYRTPFNHQKLGLEYAVRFPAFYNMDEMGLGKTRVAIERHIFLKLKNKINKTFVICPSSLIYNWAGEIKKWTNGANSLMITGSKKNKIEEINMMLKQDIDFYIINYEGISSIKDELMNLIDDKTNIIIDEFIKIKNHSAKRSKNLIDICSKTDYVMGLCGTPISQGSLDLFSPSLCIDKGKKFGFSYERFIDRYYLKYGWKVQPKRGTHDKLKELLYLNAVRHTKKECLDIPDKMYVQLPIDLPPENQNVYNQMLTFCISELEGKEVTAPIILVQLLRLSQITSGFIKTPENKIVEFKEQPKLEALSDIFDSNNGTQMIVWSRFVRDIKAMANLCMSRNISFGCLIGQDIDYNSPKDNSALGQLMELIKPIDNPVTMETIKKAYLNKVKQLHPDFNINTDQDQLKKINGLYNSLNKFNHMSLPANMLSNDYKIPSNLIGSDLYTRNDIVDKFQAGNIQVILGTASTGGMGINLTKAERVIYYANDYTLINRLQSEDRAHRAGQKNKVTYYDIIANNTIDISILNVLLGKKNIADIITGDNLLNVAKGKI